MTHALYTSRTKVHPDRTGAQKSGPNRLIVVHTSEGGEGPSSAENLAAYMTRPGDRPSPSRPGGMYGSSYQFVTDTDLTAIPCTPLDVVSYSAGGANHDGVHICIPGKAGQTRAEWHDPISREYIDTLAAIMLDVAGWEDIPLRRLRWEQVRAGESGYCGHHDVSLAYQQSDHTDPGAQFPWDSLATAIDHLQQGETDVKPFLWRPTGYLNVFIIVGADAIHASPLTCQRYGLNPNDPAQIVDDDHPQTLLSVLHKSGITRDKLVKA